MDSVVIRRGRAAWSAILWRSTRRKALGLRRQAHCNDPLSGAVEASASLTGAAAWALHEAFVLSAGVRVVNAWLVGHGWRAELAR